MHTGKLKKLYKTVTNPKPPRQREPAPSNTPVMIASAPAVSAFDHEKIELPSGLVLEASLSVPADGMSHTGSKLAVCLHPWSWLGGRMNDPVVNMMKRVMLAKGYCVLRYNSRGTGVSAGWPSFTGLQEAKDLQELVQWALDRIPSVKSVVIAGYSYGSLIASLFPLFPADKDISVSHVLISYPLGPRSFLTAFRGGLYNSTLETLLREPRANVLLCHGDRDDFTGMTNYETWVDSLRTVTDGEGKGKLRVVGIEGGNHYWGDERPRNELVAALQSFV